MAFTGPCMPVFGPASRHASVTRGMRSRTAPQPRQRSRARARVVTLGVASPSPPPRDPDLISDSEAAEATPLGKEEAERKTARVTWIRILAATLGLVASEAMGPSVTRRFTAPTPVRAEVATSERMQLRVSPSEPIPLDALGIKVEDYMGERELRARKTTQYSEAEQEIMELEEYEVATKWFRDLQALWAGLASVAGIFVLYRGGVLWERWIQEQERKDMEEEIKLTGTFISPRAVRKDEDEGDGKKGKNGKKGGKDDDDDKPPVIGDSPNIEGLNRLLK